MDKKNPKISNEMKWKKKESLYIMFCPKILENTHDDVVFFDMDQTLITTKSGLTYPNGSKDWKWLFDEVVPKKLQELHRKGSLIVLCTNQAGVEKKHVKIEEIQEKIEFMSADIDVPFMAFVATMTDKYRKPHNTMFEIFIEEFNGGHFPNSCIYIGDLAGRCSSWREGKKKDRSCSDRAFAWNCSIPFKTPEEYFLGEESVDSKMIKWDGPDPKDLFKSIEKNSFPENLLPTTKDSIEMVILVGKQASGKSHLCENYFVPNGYQRINRDTLGTVAKCEKVARETLKAGKSVIIDNTNPSIEDRKKFIEIAKELSIPVRCLVMNTPDVIIEHMNLFRERTIANSRRIPQVAYNMFNKKFQEPNKSEGFSDIVKVDFVLNNIPNSLIKYFWHRH